MNIIDTVQAYTLEVGDQILVEDDPIQVTKIDEGFLDPNDIQVVGYSHQSGDMESYTLYAFDYFDVWSV